MLLFYRSTIRSPILGDNVQPLNRAIPNSSGLLFRDYAQSSLAQKLNTVPSQITSQINNVRSPQPRQINQTEPIQKAEANPYTQVKERLSQSNTLGFQNLMRDSKNQLYQHNQPIIVNQNPDLANEKQRRKIEPPSQLREQNIFSLPEYKNQTVEDLMKQRNSNVQVSSTKSAHTNQDILDKMRRFKEIQNQSLRSPLTQNKFNVINSNRNPNSYIQFDPTPKEYKRDSISSYALGQLKDPVLEKYFPQQNFIQPSKSPVFQQNRNYGPDKVQNGPIAQDVKSSSQYKYGSNSFKSYINQQQEIEPSIQQNNNIRPPSNKAELNIEYSANPQQSLQENQSRPSSNLINKYEFERNQNNILQNDKEMIQNDQRLYQDQIPRSQTLENNISISRLKSNQIEIQRPLSNNYNNYYREGGLSSSAILQYPQSAKNLYSQSTDMQRLRQVLSSRAKLLLNQGSIQQTSNSEYGLYAGYSNRNGQDQQIPVQKEKILYQSKRDNFLRSHLPRSQSAEGQRFQHGVVNTSSQGQNINIPKSPNTFMPKYGQWALRSYNIIGNYQNPYHYEGRRNDPYAEQKFLGSRNNFSSSKNLKSPNQINYIQNQTQPDMKPDIIDELRKNERMVTSPIVVQQNQYVEPNRQINTNYLQQQQQLQQLQLEEQQPESNQQRVYGVKALRNISNIKLY